MSENDKRWRVLSSEYLIDRPWLRARKDEVQLPSGFVMYEYYVLEYPDWVNVVAITEEGDFVMERQYRHGLGKVCMEICAGVVEKGEEPLQAAKRELEEETGFGGGVENPYSRLSLEGSCNFLSSYICRRNGLEKLPEKLEIFVQMFVFSCMCAFSEYSAHKWDMTMEELAACLELGMPEPLKPYLLN